MGGKSELPEGIEPPKWERLSFAGGPEVGFRLNLR